MSRFLRFLLVSYAPMAARHALVDAQWIRRDGRSVAEKSGAGDHVCIDGIDRGGKPQHSSRACDDLDSLAA
jgi:hypothetical protein